MRSLQRLTAENFPVHAQRVAAEFLELAEIVEEFGVPDFWNRKPGFQTLLLIILEQQVSLLAARSALQRIKRGIGSISAKCIAETGESGLRQLGITRQKSRYATALAEAVTSRKLTLSRLESLPDDEVRELLTALPGIGPWTANVYLLSALGRVDIWPRGDLALEKTIDALLPNADSSWKETGERWKPNRSVAARLLWHWYLSQPQRKHIEMA